MNEGDPSKQDGSDAPFEGEADEESGESQSGAGTGGGSGPGSKMYKTTLCQFYLQGPCKNGESCNYAHGTSELRTISGKAVKDVEDQMQGM